MVVTDEVVDLFERYLDAQYMLAFAARTGSVVEMERCLRKVQQYIYDAPGCTMDVSVDRPSSPRDLAEFARTVDEDLARRNLFLVAEYEHDKWGSVYSAHVSHQRPISLGSYGRLYYAAKIDDRLLVVSEYFPNSDRPISWVHRQGVEMEGVGRPRSVRALMEPRRRAHREDWNAIKSSVH